MASYLTQSKSHGPYQESFNLRNFTLAVLWKVPSPGNGMAPSLPHFRLSSMTLLQPSVSKILTLTLDISHTTFLFHFFPLKH